MTRATPSADRARPFSGSLARLLARPLTRPLATKTGPGTAGKMRPKRADAWFQPASRAKSGGFI
jgi:hypothetical protein